MCSEIRSSQKLLVNSNPDYLVTNLNGCSLSSRNSTEMEEYGKFSAAQLVGLNYQSMYHQKFPLKNNLPTNPAVVGELQKFSSPCDGGVGDSAVSIQRLINPHFMEGSEESVTTANTSVSSGSKTDKSTSLHSASSNNVLREDQPQNIIGKHIQKNVLHSQHGHKHHPHRSKKAYMKMLPTTVEKRNARERTRVHTVNEAFHLLKKNLPQLKANTKRVSKLKILKASVNYIYSLIGLLERSLTPSRPVNIQRKSSSKINCNTVSQEEALPPPCTLPHPLRSAAALMPSISLVSNEDGCMSQPLATTFPFSETNILSQYSKSSLVNFPINSASFNSLNNYCDTDSFASAPVYNPSILGIVNGSESGDTLYTSLDSLYSGQLSSVNPPITTIVNLF